MMTDTTYDGMTYCELRQKARELARKERAYRRKAAADRSDPALQTWLDPGAGDAYLASLARRERARLERRLARMEGN